MFKSAFDGITNLLSSIWGFFSNFFVTLLDFVKSLFIPESNVIIDNFNETLSFAQSKLNYTDLSELQNLTYGTNQLVNNSDLSATISVGGVSVNSNIIDMQYVNNVKSTFHNWISGFIYILLCIYNYTQILWLIRGSYPIGSTPPPRNQIGFRG